MVPSPTLEPCLTKEVKGNKTTMCDQPLPASLCPPPSSEPGTRVQHETIHERFQRHVAHPQGSLGSLETSGQEGEEMHPLGSWRYRDKRALRCQLVQVSGVKI